MGYKNGYWPNSALVTVQGSGANALRLSVSTAAILRRMQADAAKDGVTLTLVASYRGAAAYRAWATQLDMRARPGLYNIGKGFGLPGLPSGHGNADCMDIDGGLAWVKAHGAEYGVTFPLADDHNHARYDGVTLAGETGSPVADEVPPPKKFYRLRRNKMAQGILWYVNKTSTDTAASIKAGTAWFQKYATAPVVCLDHGGVVGKSSEYTALLNLNYRMNDGTPGKDDNPEALRNFYTPITGDDLLELIAERGLVPVYASGAVSNGETITDTAAILAAIKAIPAPPTKATVTLS